MVEIVLKKGTMLSAQVSSCINSCCLFDVSDPETIIWDDDFSLCSYSSGETIYDRTEYEKALGIIIKGKAVIYKESSVREVIMSELVRGQTFGVAALFGESERYASRIKASGRETIIAYIPQRMMKRLMENDFRVAQRYIEFLSDRIRFLNCKLDLYTSATASEKLLSYLQANKKDGPINMQRLSKELDIGRATLYRALDKLCEEEKIKKEGKSIVIIEKMKEEEK